MQFATAKFMATNAGDTIARREVEVINDWGLHARPSATIASTAAKFESEITVSTSKHEAQAHSVASLLMLEAVKGTILTITAVGSDAVQALDAVVAVFESGFGEAHVVLNGHGSSSGMVEGVAHVLIDSTTDLPHYNITKAKVKKELKRLSEAVKKTKEEINDISNTTNDPQVQEFRQLVITMLEDEHFSKIPRKLISKELVNAEWAISSSVQELTDLFQQKTHELWEKHAEEYNSLLSRVLSHLQTEKTKRRKKHGAGRILVTGQIGPADVLDYQKAGYVGFVTSSGSATSHAAILARGIGFPGLVAVDHVVLSNIEEDEQLVLDSDEFELHVRPSKECLALLREKIKQQKADKDKQAKAPSKKVKYVENKCLTKDRIRIRLKANTEFDYEVRESLATSAEGIGLFRTEFIYLLNEDLPSEDEQYEYYRTVVKELDGMPVTFRTLDIGYDKSFKSVQTDQSPLGLRGIRLSLHYPEMYKTQLRALLRASAHGPLQIMLPMISSTKEVTDSIQLIHDAVDELGISRQDIPDIGAMIEIPSTVFILHDLARYCDFFSIGSNDLIQYCLAVDRNNAALAEMANPCHPGVVALLTKIIQECLDLNKPLTMCGELAGDPLMVRLYCALGLRNLSMHPAKINEIREVMENYNITANSSTAQAIAKSYSESEVQELVKKLVD